MHKICHYVDFNMQNMQNTCAKYADICSKYAANIHMCTQYALIRTKHAQNMPLHRHQHTKYAIICSEYA